MDQYKNPNWWGLDNDFAWDHVKLAMRRDWNQAKEGTANTLNRRQNVLHTARQASGIESILPLGQHDFEDMEPACRFGYGARIEYGANYPEWDDDLELRLAKDWRTINPTRMEKWEQDRIAIRYGWNFEEKNLIEPTSLLN